AGIEDSVTAAYMSGHAATDFVLAQEHRRGLSSVRALTGGRARPSLRPLGSGERFLEDVPRQHRALDPDRVLHDALEGHQVAEGLLVRFDLALHHPPALG